MRMILPPSVGRKLVDGGMHGEGGLPLPRWLGGSPFHFQYVNEYCHSELRS